MKKVTKAVIPAAGLGTRVLPATKAMPKGMLPIVDKPAIQYLVEEAVKSGITDILIILGRSQSIIEDHFDRSPELEEKAGRPRQGKNAGGVPGHLEPCQHLLCAPEADAGPGPRREHGKGLYR